MKKYKLFECGLGDIIIFLSYLKQFHENQTVLFDFNKECIKTYRESDDTYYDLIVDFSKLLLSDSNIHNIKYSNFEDIDYHMISINDIIPNYQYHSENFKYIQSVNKKNKFESEKIVIITKVRGLDYEDYEKIKFDFFDKLNNSNKKIILLGEKEIEYGYEYQMLTNKKVYSIYRDCIDNLTSEKIIDLTVNKLGVSPLNLDKLKSDIDIIKNHKVISLGSSGIVSLCSVYTETISCITKSTLNDFLDPWNSEMKTNQDFIDKIEELLN